MAEVIDLKTLREKIDQCDRQIVSAVKARLAVVGQVAETKKAKNLPIFDRVREEALFKKIHELAGEQDAPTMVALYRMMTTLSRVQEHKLSGLDKPSVNLTPGSTSTLVYKGELPAGLNRTGVLRLLVAYEVDVLEVHFEDQLVLITAGKPASAAFLQDMVEQGCPLKLFLTTHPTGVC